MWDVIAGLLLLVHGFVHLRVWVLGGVRRPPADARRSRLPGVPPGASTALAVIAATLFAAAGAGALASQDWAPAGALAASIASIALLALAFNRWLSLGLAIDAVVLVLAVRALAS